LTPPGDPSCANGNPQLCPSQPGQPVAVPGNLVVDRTDQSLDSADVIYQKALKTSGGAVGNVAETQKKSWLDLMDEYGLPGSHQNVGDKFGEWFYNEHPELFHLSLDVLGLVPVVGEYFDGMNASLYASEGDYANAALSASSMIPVAGWIPAGGKIGNKALKLLKGAEKACKVAPNSFVAGTRVLMADGSAKAIEDVKVGDWVTATDPITGDSAPQRVVGTIVGFGSKRLIEIEAVESRTLSPSFKSTIVATEGHPFFIQSQDRWLNASELRSGDVMRDIQSGVTVTVASVRARTAAAVVYNLTISSVHTYYVLAGQSPVLVHNAGVGSTDPLNFGGGYTGRLDRINIGGTADFEVHVYQRGKEVGIFGSNGWFPKHGKSADVAVPQDVYNNLKGLAVGEMRAAGRLGPKGSENIKGDNWKRPRITGGC
jgi:hypothetical protein